MRLSAPAKVNLVLHVGPRRADGLHELCSLFAPLGLADELTVELSRTGRDEVVCPGVAPEENLAARALAAYREQSPLPPLRLVIDKRIPVAGGLGGGSADAAAALRAADALAERPLGPDRLRALAAGLGADVPSQVEPAPTLVTGAGERVEPVELPVLDLVLIAQPEGLSTARVYEQLDRQGGGRERLDAAALRELAAGPREQLIEAVENDLGPAALALRPELAESLTALRNAGALTASLSGSGPTAFGAFADHDAAERAAAELPGAIQTRTRERRAMRHNGPRAWT